MRRRVYTFIIAGLAMAFWGLHGVSDNCVAGMILDTDISSDADDVGAVAVLHAMARDADIEILAVMVSSGDPYSAPSVTALNRYFSRPDVPVGVVSTPRVTHESSYSKTLGRIVEQTQDIYADSVDLYRRVLAGQPDNSVTVVTIGYLTNLEALLASSGDQYSPLAGIDLVRKKVKLFVCMGGDYPRGKEWNFYQDTHSTQAVVKNWPTRIVFMGYSLGLQIMTGQPLRNDPETSPVRQAYLLHNKFSGRPSWDQLAVLYAGLDDRLRKQLFTISEPGINSISSDGSNHWRRDRAGTHYFVGSIENKKALTERINTMMRSR